MGQTVPYHASFKKTGNDLDDDLVSIEPSTSPTKCPAVKHSVSVEYGKTTCLAPDLAPPERAFATLTTAHLDSTSA